MYAHSDLNKNVDLKRTDQNSLTLVNASNSYLSYVSLHGCHTWVVLVLSHIVSCHVTKSLCQGAVTL